MFVIRVGVLIVCLSALLVANMLSLPLAASCFDTSMFQSPISTTSGLVFPIITLISFSMVSRHLQHSHQGDGICLQYKYFACVAIQVQPTISMSGVHFVICSSTDIWYFEPAYIAKPPPHSLPLALVLSALKNLYRGILNIDESCESFRFVSCRRSKSKFSGSSKILSSSMFLNKLQMFSELYTIPLRDFTLSRAVLVLIYK